MPDSVPTCHGCWRRLPIATVAPARAACDACGLDFDPSDRSTFYSGRLSVPAILDLHLVVLSVIVGGIAVAVVANGPASRLWVGLAMLGILQFPLWTRFGDLTRLGPRHGKRRRVHIWANEVLVATATLAATLLAPAG